MASTKDKRIALTLSKVAPANPFEVLMIQFGMKDWKLARWEQDLAMVSPVFRCLLRQVHETYSGVGQLMPLAELWEIAGSPPDKTPASHAKDWAASDGPTDLGVIEDRGEGGVWADFEITAWYAEALCDHIGPEHVLEMCY